MSVEEFMLWARLNEVDPWDEHIDFGFGVVGSMVANYAGKMRPGGEPAVQPSDVMPLPRPKIIEEPDPVKFFGAF